MAWVLFGEMYAKMKELGPAVGCVPVYQAKHTPTKIILAKAIHNGHRFIHIYL